MISEPLLNIATQVRMHRNRALILAEIERLPPGYTKMSWAVLLMDNDYNQLLSRYTKKVAVEQLRLPADRLRQLADSGQSFLPTVPRDLPAELISKTREIHNKWLGKLVEQACLNALQPLMGLSRSVPTVAKCRDILQETLGSLKEQLGQMPFSAKVTMDKDGAVTLIVQEKPLGGACTDGQEA